MPPPFDRSDLIMAVIALALMGNLLAAVRSMRARRRLQGTGGKGDGSDVSFDIEEGRSAGNGDSGSCGGEGGDGGGGGDCIRQSSRFQAAMRIGVRQ